MAVVFDVEADGLLDEATKLHCLSYHDLKTGDKETLYSINEMRDFLLNVDTLVGHNIIRYDIPVLERLLNIKITARLIDTLPLSWYLETKRNVHGLEDWGRTFGVEKPPIEDWENLTPEEYGHRCAEDVRINLRLWKHLKQKLLKVYGSAKAADRFLRYLSFKLDCAREQEKSKWKLDVERVERNVAKLEKLQEEKLLELQKVMPPVLVYTTRKRPAKPFKKDGSYSSHGEKWFSLLEEMKLPKEHEEPITIQIGEKEPNPNSPDQVKTWLHSLGWKPETYKFSKDSNGNDRKIEQLRTEEDGNKVLCPSVIKLAEKVPEVGLLEGLSVIQHRLGIFKGYQEKQRSGLLIAEIAGLTNTLRFRHKKPLVNLPGVSKAYGKELRGSLIAREGNLLCGSDMVSLEDTTKRHYMYKYDPEYVEEMSREGFDPHLDLAKYAGVVTQLEIDDWQAERPGAKNLKPIRQNYKVTNYSATYGIQPPKLSRDLGITRAEAQELLDSFWDRNKAILQVVESIRVEEVDGQLWLFNPVSRFWYSLRNRKDIFSTLNQGTGVYCFDTWIKHWRKRRPQLTAQFHDEIISEIPIGKEAAYEKLLRDAMVDTNKELNLNIKLDIDVQFGKNYAEIH